MRLPLKGIPANVLYGEVPKFRKVQTTYSSIMSYELMKRINASFWARAKRGADDLGNTWKPLAPRTHIYKPLSPMEKETYELDGTEVRGLLTPMQDQLWKTIFARTYNRMVKKGSPPSEAKKEAAKRAWGVVKARGGRTKLDTFSGRITDTNIRYGRLVAATRPGTVSNNRYYPPKNQKVVIGNRGQISITFNIPYIKKVDAVRPVIPNNIGPWILQAHEIAVEAALKVYNEILAKQPNRQPRQSKYISDTEAYTLAANRLGYRPEYTSNPKRMVLAGKRSNIAGRYEWEISVPISRNKVNREELDRALRRIKR